MDEAYLEARKRMETKKSEHTKRLKTPAMYALEVYLQAFMIEGLSKEDYEENDSMRLRFKFLDYACIEVKKFSDEEESRKADMDETTDSSPSSPSSPSTPTKSTRSGDEQKTSPGEKTDSGTKQGVEIAKTEESKDKSAEQGGAQPDAKGDDGNKTDAQDKQEKKKPEGKSGKPGDSTSQATEKTGGDSALPSDQAGAKSPEQTRTLENELSIEDDSPGSAASSSTPSPIPSSLSSEEDEDEKTRSQKKKKDPRYFDPRKLLKPKPQPGQKEEETDLEQEGDFETAQQNPDTPGKQEGTTEEGKPQDGESQPERPETRRSLGAQQDGGDGASKGNNRPDDDASSKMTDVDNKPDGSTAGGETTLTSEQGGTTSEQTKTTGNAPGTTSGEDDEKAQTMMEQGEGDVSEEDRSSALSFENGKSVIFCKDPLDLLYSLPRFPLIVIFFRPPAEVLGLCRIDLSSLADAVDKSIVLTRSIPLSGVIRDSFDIMQRGRKIGTADVDVRLSCFGPFLLHRIFMQGNPNEKTLQLTENTNSKRLIVVEMSAAHLGLVRNKSKMFVSKSQTTLVGKVARDVSEFPPIICADEHILEPPPKPKPEPNAVEEEEREKEEARVASLSRFPQYKCIDDWEVVFTRNVIKDLIAKNRRPFQHGSPDRIYIESYFPELMPSQSEGKGDASPRRPGSPGKRKRKPKKAASTSQPSSLYYLPLAKDWVKEHNIDRIRRKSARPTVRTSFSNSSPVTINKSALSSPSGVGMPSSMSLAKLPTHNVKSMSHVAINHFDVDRGAFEEDSRIVGRQTYSTGRSGSEPPDDKFGPIMDSQNCSRVAVFHYDPNKKCQPKSLQSVEGSLKRAPVTTIFNTRHPRVDSSWEKYNPIPEKPFTMEITAPERSLADKLVQAIKVYGDEVEAIGGDTKVLYDNFCENTHETVCLAPPHIQKRSLRTTNSPEASTFGIQDVETVAIEVDKGVPLAVPARSTPYWEGHAPVCSDPTNCPHYLILHSGFGYYGR